VNKSTPTNPNNDILIKALGISLAFFLLFLIIVMAINDFNPISSRLPIQTPGNTNIPTANPTIQTLKPTSTVPQTPHPPSEATGQTLKPTSTLSPTLNLPSEAAGTLTPTSSVGGIVTVPNLNVRWGPSIEYTRIYVINESEEVVILGRNSNGTWLKIETPDKRMGWVAAEYITKSVNIASLPILIAPELPKPIINRIEGQAITKRINPYKEHWYTFSVEGQGGNRDFIVILMFEPNMSAEFFVYDFSESRIWPPGNANSLPHIGTGMHPVRDRDGDLSTGELIWRGPLTRGSRYYLRLVNGSPETLNYCLATTDVYEWSCP
jgi:hypothetical protein